MDKLILIRHGQTDYTQDKRYCGHTNIPLNKDGRRQVRRLRSKLKKIKIDKVYSSDLRRAVQTAKLLFRGKRVLKQKALREFDFGIFCGLTYKEVERLYPNIYDRWIKKPGSIKIPEGEDMRNFIQRVTAGLTKIASQNKKKTVAIVSHGGVIRIMLIKILKLGLDRFWDIEQRAAALNIIEYTDKEPKIVKLNNTSYLK